MACVLGDNLRLPRCVGSVVSAQAKIDNWDKSRILSDINRNALKILDKKVLEGDEKFIDLALTYTQERPKVTQEIQTTTPESKKIESGLDNLVEFDLEKLG